MTNAEKRGEQKLMEYEDAPSGSVMLYNYKEPFMKFEGGFGYQGVLLFDTHDERVQCHFCGGWYGMLQFHLRKEHAMTTAQYKKRVGLRRTTALMGEKVRASFIKNGLEKRKALLVARKWSGHTPESRAKISATLAENLRENQNRLGTCPEQLLQRVRDKYRELNRTPKMDEVRGRDTIIKMYGNWQTVCETAGVPYISTKHPTTKLRHTEDTVIAWILDFLEKNNRMPTAWDVRTSDRRSMLIMVNRRMGGWEHMVRKAIEGRRQYAEVIHQIYSPRQLLLLLTRFKTREGRNPSPSDSRRGLIPSQYFYQKHFGSFTKALKKI